ncbi:MAG: sigma-54-dependent Fis family transcriptional regulator [Syntrophaceae bacterium]|nr:sigma-54-dependent Fis family transcriptional regulator [Syntrophaceae bacterium]
MERILVVDDDRGMQDMLDIMLSREGYQVATADDGAAALEIIRKKKFDLVITDLKMPRVDGIDLLRGVKEAAPETAVILLTAFASGETALAAMREGAYDYVEKNFNVDDLLTIVRDALEKREAERKQATAAPQEGNDTRYFGTMVGRSKEMQKVYALISKVADTPANVLLLGESGTGKELVARAIHGNSARRAKPFVAINCGGIPENLLESELFGYMKGSFTGAFADRAGLFEVARGGTIFLDEIAELPVVLQVKLLRVLQERTIRRIGGSEDIKTDVRIISATNQDLQEKVRRGEFREDLYFRLNVIPVRIPPLRERREDIPLLVQHFIEKYTREFGKEIKRISAYALELLMRYPFPGNIRELENIIERSVALESSSIILPENLIIAEEGNSAAAAAGCAGEFPEGGIDLNRELERFEREIIRKALERAKGSKTKAASLLGVSFPSLRHRLEKLGMEGGNGDGK